jgi:outer membrane receptor protein involved in Fe transport
VREVVTVLGTAPLLERSSPELSTVIQSTQLEQLPLNGRHWSSLMMLAPGAINTGAGTHTSIRFVGRSVDDNNWTFDGVDATGVKDPKQESVARLIISMESISEFRVSSSQYSAEAGSAGGGVIQLISKSGTNRFRGTAYDFVRNDKFDAPAFGDEGDPPPFRLNQFGANFGGPLIKERTFFFANYEGLRQRQAETFVGFVPSAAYRAAAAQGNAALLRGYPAGTSATSDPNIDRWTTEQKTVSDENSFMGRIDHRFSNRTTVFGRYSFDRAAGTDPGDTGVTRLQFRPSNLAVHLQHIFTPNIVNEVKFGVNKSLLDNARRGPFNEQITVPGFVALVGAQDTIEHGRSYGVVDNLAIARGRHNFKVGGEIRRIFVAVGEGNTTTLTYSSRPDFTANRLNSFQIVDFPISEGERWYYFGYAQDDVKVKPNLTLNLGLRYEYYSVVKEVHDRGKVFAIECGGFCPQGTPFYDKDPNNFAPRLGFAWVPGRLHDRTVVRGGFGVFFGPGQNDDVFAPIDNTGNRIGLDRTQAATLTYPIDPFLAQALTSGRSPRALALHRSDMYVNQYSVSVQQVLPGALTFQVGYVGNKGYNLFSRSFTNIIDPATGRRQLPQFGQVDIKANDGRAEFNALQLSLRRRFTGGLLLGTEYMWSHALNDGSVGGGDANAAQNVNNRAADWGPSAQDVRHNVTVNWVYELPFGQGRRFMADGVGASVLGGWQASGLVQARTGRPLTILVTRARTDVPDGNSGNSTTSGSQQRPDLVPGVPLKPPSGQSPDLWINPAAFAVPARGTWGTAGRGVLRGPGLVQVDFALTRRFAIRAEQNIEMRWEVFNLFDRQNLANPNLNISSGPSFGRITGPANPDFGTGSARQMQFMLRVNF